MVKPFKGFLMVTSKKGLPSDPLRPIAQILKASTHSGLLTPEEARDILQGVGVWKRDSYRVLKALLENGYLKKI